MLSIKNIVLAKMNYICMDMKIFKNIKKIVFFCLISIIHILFWYLFLTYLKKEKQCFRLKNYVNQDKWEIH